MRAILMLEDGKSFKADTLVSGEQVGEIIINTAVVGYQEMMTDPANAGKILVLTYPLIGNYGCAPKFNESDNVWLAGLIIREKTRIFSNWQAKESFDDFVKRHNLLVLFGVDTRTLTVHLRQKGAMLSIISSETFQQDDLLKKIEVYRKKKADSILPKVSVNKPRNFGKNSAKKRIAIMDIGITNSTLRQLEILGLSGTIFPYKTSAGEILKNKPVGLIISTGPEADPGLREVAENIKPLLGKIPMLGVSTGAQVLALALGAKVSKMNVGHRGVNYPIHDPASYKGEITVQNHGWVIDADSLSKIKEIKISGFNLNDRSVEEFESKKLKLLGTQYIASSPGFDEVNSALKKFVKMVSK